MKILLILIGVSGSALSHSFSIMSYNVENLFDTKDDLNHADETYLPSFQKGNRQHKEKCKLLSNFKYRKDCYQLDWNPKVLEAKMKNLSQIILSVDQGRGPDILILVEVENFGILEDFNQRFLKSARYQTIEIREGEDPRGINVAVLSRFPVSGSAHLFSLKISDPKTNKRLKTRGVLRVPLKINNEIILAIYAAHLPSQGSSTQIRTQAIAELHKILKTERQSWIVGGDFNITKEEDEKSLLISGQMARYGIVSHFIGCKNCRGTHFYKNKWSFLDMLYFDFRLSSQGVSVLNESIQIVSSGVNRPNRFNPAKGQGASDHFPIYARLKVEKQNK